MEFRMIDSTSSLSARCSLIPLPILYTYYPNVCYHRYHKSKLFEYSIHIITIFQRCFYINYFYPKPIHLTFTDRWDRTFCLSPWIKLNISHIAMQVLQHWPVLRCCPLASYVPLPKCWQCERACAELTILYNSKTPGLQCPT